MDGPPFHGSTDWYHDTELAGFNMSVGRRSNLLRRSRERRSLYAREDRARGRDQGERERTVIEINRFALDDMVESAGALMM